MWLFIYYIKHKIYDLVSSSNFKYKSDQKLPTYYLQGFIYRDVLRILWTKADVDEITKFYPPPGIFYDIRPNLAVRVVQYTKVQ